MDRHVIHVLMRHAFKVCPIGRPPTFLCDCVRKNIGLILGLYGTVILTKTLAISHVMNITSSFFYVHVTVHRNKFIIKPTRCTNFTNLFWHENLHVSDSSSVHHQEFIHCTLSSGICHTGL